MAPAAKRHRVREIVINLLLMLMGPALLIVALEFYLAWDNRRPKVTFSSMELGGRTYHFMVPGEALADLRARALIIGDSFTAGAACGIERSYPGRLDQLFVRNGDPYRALNLGMPGSDPLVYLQLVESLVALDRPPPLVVVTLFSNDIEPTCSACRFLDRIRRDPAFSAAEIARLDSLCGVCAKAREARTAHHGLRRRIHNWLLLRSYTYALFRDALVGLSMRFGYNVGWGRTAYPPLWRNHGGTEFKLLKFALKGIQDALSPRGGRMVVAIYPDVENLSETNEYVRIYQDVEADLSRSLGVPVWSGYAAFLNRKDAKKNMSFSIVDHHPSCKAHQMFAEGLYMRLREAGLTSAAAGARP